MTCRSCAGVAPLCPDCRAQRLTWLRGPAACRGARWATETRARRLPGRWPSWATSARVRELARDWVVDRAGGDLELLDQLGQVCAEAAAAEYANPAPRAGAVAFTVG